MQCRLITSAAQPGSKYRNVQLSNRTGRKKISTRNNPVLVLGIETSCDDTSVSIVDSNRKIHALYTCNQNDLHEPMGGVVPNKAALAHSTRLPALLRKTLDSALLSLPAHLSQLDAVAVTRGPGLAPCLAVGLIAARNICALINKPLIGVHHMEAHALTPRLTEPIPPSFPYLSLLISGGHTLLILTKGLSNHTILGESLDDNIGDTFDKVARALGLPWLNRGGGAGAAVEFEAQKAALETSLQFPVPLSDGRDTRESRLNFSFSGLKTYVLRYIQEQADKNQLCSAKRAEIANAFQIAVGIHLTTRLRRAIHYCTHNQGIDLKAVVLSGGVAANQYLGAQLRHVVATQFQLPVLIPPSTLCTDNAAMVAWTGIEQYEAGLGTDMGWETRYIPKWPLSHLN